MPHLPILANAPQAEPAQRWADELGIDKSELLREALHRHLTRLASEHDTDLERGGTGSARFVPNVSRAIGLFRLAEQRGLPGTNLRDSERELRDFERE